MAADESRPTPQVERQLRDSFRVSLAGGQAFDGALQERFVVGKVFKRPALREADDGHEIVGAYRPIDEVGEEPAHVDRSDGIDKQIVKSDQVDVALAPLTRVAGDVGPGKFHWLSRSRRARRDGWGLRDGNPDRGKRDDVL